MEGSRAAEENQLIWQRVMQLLENCATFRAMRVESSTGVRQMVLKGHDPTDVA
jgi:hypothetical protein